MSITKYWKDSFIWWVYIPIGVFVLYAFSKLAVTTPLFGDGYFVFLLLGIIIALFPVRTEDRIFSFVSGVSLASFSIYGLLPEMFISSLATVVALAKADIKLDQHQRYPLNLLAGNILSVASAGAYVLTEQVLAFYQLEGLIIFPLVAYLLIHMFLNQLQRYLVERYYYKQNHVQFFDNLLAFSFRTGIYLLPLSYILIYLYQQMDLIGVGVGAIPFIVVTIGTKAYYKSSHYNSMLIEVSLYAQRLSLKTRYKDVIRAFIKYILEIFPSEQVYYFGVVDEETIHLNRYYRYNETSEHTEEDILFSNHSGLMTVLETREIAVYQKAEQWRSYAYNEANYTPESAVVVPVILAGEKEGVILITHSNQAIYDDFLVSLIEVFYQYFNIVLSNVHQLRTLEDTNYTDYLTQLPNLSGFYKHFDSVLEEETYRQLSLIIIDLDYFKCVNDVHGHEAGNETLFQIAHVLSKFANESCFVARYGGEEFLFLTEGLTKEETYHLAEEVRKIIEATEFIINNSIASEQIESINLTASLGLAHYPDDVEDVQELVKLADRAMYSGSKQQGRNMVTSYNSEM